MKKLFTILACVLFACMAVTACGGAHAATTNTFASTDYAGATRIYSVDHVRMITVTGGAFTLQYDDGNSSEAFADTSGAQLASLLLNAPALKDFKRLGTSGIYISPSAARKMQCQYGTSTPGQATQTGDHMFLIWTPPGYLLVEDFSCATYNTIKANSN